MVRRVGRENYVGQLLDCLGLREPARGGRGESETEEGEDRRIRRALRGVGCGGCRGVGGFLRWWAETRGSGNYYESRQVKLD